MTLDRTVFRRGENAETRRLKKIFSSPGEVNLQVSLRLKFVFKMPMLSS